MLLLAGTHILGRDIYNAVGVDIEGHLDLGHASAGRGDAVQLKPAEGLVVGGHLTLALEDMDIHRGLVVGCGGEDLALLNRDGGVAVDDSGADTAEGLEAQGQRG